MDAGFAEACAIEEQHDCEHKHARLARNEKFASAVFATSSITGLVALIHQALPARHDVILTCSILSAYSLYSALTSHWGKNDARHQAKVHRDDVSTLQNSPSEATLSALAQKYKSIYDF